MVRSAEDEDALDAVEAEGAPPGVEDLAVNVSTPLHPTEDEGSVSRALLNMFPTLEVRRGEGSMEGKGSGPMTLARLRRKLREMRIRDTARRVFMSGVGDGTLSFSLNKQSAYANVPNFSTGGAPLGDIVVEVATARPDALVDWLCELDEE